MNERVFWEIVPTHFGVNLVVEDKYTYIETKINVKESLGIKQLIEETISKYRKISEWFLNGDVGQSSKTLVAHMIGMQSEINHPYDKSDRKRCIKILELFPEWISRLDEMKIYQGWEEQIKLIKQEIKK